MHFWKNNPYGKICKILFRKFSSRYRLTLLCSNFVKFGRRKIGDIVRYLPDKKKQNFACLSNYRYCADRAQNLPELAPNNVLNAPYIIQIGSLSAELQPNA